MGGGVSYVVLHCTKSDVDSCPLCPPRIEGLRITVFFMKRCEVPLSIADTDWLASLHIVKATNKTLFV